MGTMNFRSISTSKNSKVKPVHPLPPWQFHPPNLYHDLIVSHGMNLLPSLLLPPPAFVWFRGTTSLGGKKNAPKMRREGTSDVFFLFALFRSISGNKYGIPNKVQNVRKAQRNPIRYIVVTCHFRFRKKTGTIWSWVHSNGCNHDVDISTASLFHCSWW